MRLRGEIRGWFVGGVKKIHKEPQVFMAVNGGTEVKLISVRTDMEVIKAGELEYREPPKGGLTSAREIVKVMLAEMVAEQTDEQAKGKTTQDMPRVEGDEGTERQKREGKRKRRQKEEKGNDGSAEEKKRPRRKRNKTPKSAPEEEPEEETEEEQHKRPARKQRNKPGGSKGQRKRKGRKTRFTHKKSRSTRDPVAEKSLEDCLRALPSTLSHELSKVLKKTFQERDHSALASTGSSTASSLASSASCTTSSQVSASASTSASASSLAKESLSASLANEAPGASASELLARLLQLSPQTSSHPPSPHASSELLIQFLQLLLQASSPSSSHPPSELHTQLLPRPLSPAPSSQLSFELLAELLQSPELLSLLLQLQQGLSPHRSTLPQSARALTLATDLLAELLRLQQPPEVPRPYASQESPLELLLSAVRPPLLGHASALVGWSAPH
jgi:hypothetical protein